jgi:methylamine dehydrogenase accessory protein MauD
LVIALVFVVVVLARQVGLLTVRLGPTAARFIPHGPQIGEVLPRREYQDVAGNLRAIGGSSRRPTLLAFVAPGCSVCDEFASALDGLARSERNLAVVAIAIGGDDESSQAAAERWWDGRIPLILSAQAVVDFQVQSSPYALILDASGVVKAKGLVNQVEHLHSLLNALETGYATLDQYVLAERNGRAEVPATASVGADGVEGGR